MCVPCRKIAAAFKFVQSAQNNGTLKGSNPSCQNSGLLSQWYYHLCLVFKVMYVLFICEYACTRENRPIREHIAKQMQFE